MLEIPSSIAATSRLGEIVRRYGLTPSECDVLRRLAAGETTAAIADARRISRVTVRTHLRALFDKTGCRRQSDLIR